jgi:hypothetical protein
MFNLRICGIKETTTSIGSNCNIQHRCKIELRAQSVVVGTVIGIEIIGELNGEVLESSLVLIVEKITNLDFFGVTILRLAIISPLIIMNIWSRGGMGRNVKMKRMSCLCEFRILWLLDAGGYTLRLELGDGDSMELHRGEKKEENELLFDAHRHFQHIATPINSRQFQNGKC